MRHRKGNRKLSLPTDQRLALLVGLTKAVLQHGHVRTTLHRARAAARMVDQCIQLAKTQGLAPRRKMFQLLQDHQLVQKTCGELATRFQNRSGGYSRVLKAGVRKGDGSTLALLTLQHSQS